MAQRVAQKKMTLDNLASKIDAQISVLLKEMRDLRKKINVVGDSIVAYIGYDPNAVVSSRKVTARLDNATLENIRKIFVRIAEKFNLKLIAMQQTSKCMQMCCRYDLSS